MGIIDVFTRVSNAQDLTGEADDTIISTNAIPLSGSTSRLRDVGAGGYTAMRFYIPIATSVAFNVELSADSGTLDQIIATTGAVLVADLTAGSSFDVPIPPLPQTLDDGLLRQYMLASYTIVGTVAAGSVTASIVTDTVAPGPRKHVTGYTGP
jgi:hypothetical protein